MTNNFKMNFLRHRYLGNSKETPPKYSSLITSLFTTSGKLTSPIWLIILYAHFYFYFYSITYSIAMLFVLIIKWPVTSEGNTQKGWLFHAFSYSPNHLQLTFLESVSPFINTTLFLFTLPFSFAQFHHLTNPNFFFEILRHFSYRILHPFSSTDKALE